MTINNYPTASLAIISAQDVVTSQGCTIISVLDVSNLQLKIKTVLNSSHNVSLHKFSCERKTFIYRLFEIQNFSNSHKIVCKCAI